MKSASHFEFPAGRKPNGCRRLVILLPLLALAVSGCRTARVDEDLPMPISAAKSRQLGRVALSLGGTQAPFQFQTPVPKSEARGEASMQMAFGWLPALGEGGSPEGAGMILVAGMMWAPFGALAGAVVGQARGETPEKIEAGMQVLRKLGSDLRPGAPLLREISTALAARSGNPDSVIEPLPDSSASRAVLAGPAADTLLELKIEHAWLMGGEGINPPLGLCVLLRVNVLRARDGQRLHSMRVDYFGPRRRFREWVAGDGAVLSAEITRCWQVLATRLAGALYPAEVAGLSPQRRGEFTFPCLASGIPSAQAVPASRLELLPPGNSPTL